MAHVANRTPDVNFLPERKERPEPVRLTKLTRVRERVCWLWREAPLRRTPALAGACLEHAQLLRHATSSHRLSLPLDDELVDLALLPSLPSLTEPLVDPS